MTKEKDLIQHREPTPLERKRIEHAKEARERTRGNQFQYIERPNSEGGNCVLPMFNNGLNPRDAILELMGRLCESIGYDNPQVALDRVCELTRVLATPNCSAKERDILLNRVADQMLEYAPEDAIEAELVSQIIILRHRMQKYQIRADNSDMFDHLQLYENIANKLSIRLTAALEALSRHRRAGKQEVQVTHMHQHNHPGSQGIVAKELHGGGGDKKKHRGST